VLSELSPKPNLQSNKKNIIRKKLFQQKYENNLLGSVLLGCSMAHHAQFFGYIAIDLQAIAGLFVLIIKNALPIKFNSLLIKKG